MNSIKKPEVGIKPKFIHDEHRLIKIDDAILRFVENGQSIPIEWITERDQLIEVIGARKLKYNRT
ncbi:hypothetical protein [Moritella sp.]|uniref:hypothetical protein n=1 Tax=Moritella sp. TaxID=78556 RepID=UPI0025F8F66E|nr:hypothetical protein [Moritella sp.]MCJ8352356.1 hypothetical protein [Moritella sp.]